MSTTQDEYDDLVKILNAKASTALSNVGNYNKTMKAYKSQYQKDDSKKFMLVEAYEYAKIVNSCRNASISLRGSINGLIKKHTNISTRDIKNFPNFDFEENKKELTGYLGEDIVDYAKKAEEDTKKQVALFTEKDKKTFLGSTKFSPKHIVALMTLIQTIYNNPNVKMDVGDILEALRKVSSKTGISFTESAFNEAIKILHDKVFTKIPVWKNISELKDDNPLLTMANAWAKVTPLTSQLLIKANTKTSGNPELSAHNARVEGESVACFSPQLALLTRSLLTDAHADQLDKKIPVYVGSYTGEKVVVANLENAGYYLGDSHGDVSLLVVNDMSKLPSDANSDLKTMNCYVSPEFARDNFSIEISASS